MSESERPLKRSPAPQPPDDRSWTAAGLAPDAYEALADRLPASALWSLLLDVFERRARRRTPAAVLQQWERDGFSRPAAVDQRTSLAIDARLLEAAEGFEAIELSPLAPLATCTAVALSGQRRIVSALRGTEVVGDPTNVLALEAARRLRREPARPVHLATCHRCVRAQAVPKHPGFAPHFRIFCLASAGRERKDRGFLREAIVTHITTHLRALDALEKDGYEFPDRRLTLLATPAMNAVADQIAAALPSERFARSPLTHAYYDGLRFMIDVRGTAGMSVPLVDGGAFDWVRRLTSNDKQVFVASGMGSQLAALLFRRPAE